MSCVVRWRSDALNRSRCQAQEINELDKTQMGTVSMDVATAHATKAESEAAFEPRIASVPEGDTMAYSRVDPALPTIGRWLQLNKRFPGDSTLRKLEYEKLFDLEIAGHVLDLGGGARSKYREKLPQDIEYSSVNIDPDIDPTWLVEPGEPLPIADDTFDVCLSMNTLEHVYDPKFLINEIYRTLKPGGVVHISVPWIFRIHAHPDDYTRATPSWWRQAMSDAGFSDTEVTPLVWGRYSTASSICGFRGLFRKTRNHLTHIRDVLYAAFVFRGTGGRYSGRRGERVCNVALGHFISAKK